MKKLIIIISLLLSISIFADPLNNGKRETKSTISVGLVGATLKPGIYYDYFINEPIELEVGLGGIGIFDHSITIGAKYHYYITDNFTTYIAINETYFKDFITFAQVGLRYEMDCGVTSSLSLGGMVKYRSEVHRFEQGVIAGLQLGYSF